MPDLKQLLREIHRRSLWQVLSVYVAGSWGTYQVVEMVVANTALPELVLPLALVLLLIGLPIVVATAIVQEGVHRKHSADEGGGVAAAAATGPVTEGGRAVFTWRNTVMGGLAAFALVGAIAIGWLVRVYVFGDGPAVGSADGIEMIAEVADVDAADIERDAAEEEAVAGAGAGDAATVPPPSPQTSPPPVRVADDGGDDGGRAAFNAAVPWEAAESEWAAGESAAAAGRFGDAAAAMDRATTAYSRANDGAEATWRTRVATARTALTAARSGSDPASAGYASAMLLQDEAARREGGGDLPGAFDALTEAGDLYRSAQSPVGAPAEAEEPEQPARPAPREIVGETFARLSQALAAEDISAVRRVWTSLSAQQASNFESFFEQYDDLHVDYAPDWSSMSEGGDDISVSVRATWRYLDGTHAEQQPPFEQNFVLSNVGGRWVITGG